jgi:hypothetical protein
MDDVRPPECALTGNAVLPGDIAGPVLRVVAKVPIQTFDCNPFIASNGMANHYHIFSSLHE